MINVLKRGTCTIPGCDRPHAGRGYCVKHWERWRRYGDPEKGKDYGSALKFYNEVVLPWKDSNCLLWPHAIGTHGYALIGTEPKLVHRLVCETVHGPQPTPRHEVAHSCGTKTCVNGNHLRWATHVENEADKRIHGVRIGRPPKNLDRD